MSNAIPIKVSWRGEELQVFMKEINYSEEQKIRQAFLGLKESEKELKEFQLNVETLAKYHADDEFPFATQEVEVKSKDPLPEGQPNPTERKLVQLKGQSPALAIRDFFKEKNIKKERIAEQGVRAYFQALQPSVDFL